MIQINFLMEKNVRREFVEGAKICLKIYFSCISCCAPWTLHFHRGNSIHNKSSSCAEYRICVTKYKIRCGTNNDRKNLWMRFYFFPFCVLGEAVIARFSSSGDFSIFAAESNGGIAWKERERGDRYPVVAKTTLYSRSSGEIEENGIVCTLYLADKSIAAHFTRRSRSCVLCSQPLEPQGRSRIIKKTDKEPRVFVLIASRRLRLRMLLVSRHCSRSDRLRRNTNVRTPRIVRIVVIFGSDIQKLAFAENYRASITKFSVSLKVGKLSVFPHSR